MNVFQFAIARKWAQLQRREPLSRDDFKLLIFCEEWVERFALRPLEINWK
jgi:hypothetical protein